MEDRKARLAALAAKAGRNNDGVRSQDVDDSSVTTTTGQQQHRQHGDDENDSHRNYPDDNTAPKKRKLHFRNYIPSDPTLTMDHNVIINTTDERNEINTQLPNANTTTTSTTTVTKSPLQLALEKARSEILNTTATNKSSSLKLQADGGSSNNMLSISKIANEQWKPKINADLKRNIQSKLQLLEKRTQKALVSILRERLEQEATVQSSTNDKGSNDLD